MRIVFEYTVFCLIAIFIHVCGVVATVGASILYCSRLSGEKITPKLAVEMFFQPMQRVAAAEVGKEFLQVKSNTCGPAALAYLLSLYGRDTTQEEVIRRVNLQQDGVSMFDLAKAAEHFGFRAWGEQQNWEALRIQPKPLIAYINSNHYVVILDIVENLVNVFDPLVGYGQIDRKTFDRIWNGVVFLVTVQPIVPS